MKLNDHIVFFFFFLTLVMFDQCSHSPLQLKKHHFQPAICPRTLFTLTDGRSSNQTFSASHLPAHCSLFSPHWRMVDRCRRQQFGCSPWCVRGKRKTLKKKEKKSVRLFFCSRCARNRAWPEIMCRGKKGLKKETWDHSRSCAMVDGKLEIGTNSG